MYALQLIHPSGGKNMYFAFQCKPNGYDIIADCRLANMPSSLVGRVTALEMRGLASNFNAVYSGVKRAFTEKVVRLQNPILLLEYGMQLGNGVLAMLMFVMGLDMLFMAGEKAPFVKRISGFFGADSYIFPPVLSMNYQSKITVSEVIDDLFEFRNVVAHGREIPKAPYRRRFDVSKVTGLLDPQMQYSYAELLRESALFLLTGALTKIFTENLYDDISDERKWKARLTRYEHRFKDTGGAALKSPRKSR